MNKKHLFLIICIFCIAGGGYGQVPPIKDKNWVRNIALSDEFNGTSVDTAKWKTDNVYAWHAHAYARNATIEDIPPTKTNSNDPLISRNRMLRLRGESKWSTGGIQTKSENYLYGYYEMRAKLPGYWSIDSAKHCSRGFWPTLYVAHQVRDPNNKDCIIEHNEIDIVEPNGYKNGFGEWTDDAQSNTIGHHMLMEYNPCEHTKLSPKGIHNLPPVYENFHKYAAECLPDRIIYYFDDVPIHTVFASNEIPLPNTLMMVTICFQMNYKTVFTGYNTPWPLYYDVDYFRYYQLNTQYCNTDALIINNTQLSNFVYGVRRNITIGNGSTAISLNAGESVTFRATNDVIINGDFTVPLGSELNIIPTPCPE